MRECSCMRAQRQTGALCKVGGVCRPHHVLETDDVADACSAANKEDPANEVKEGEFNDGGGDQGEDDDLPQTFSDDGDVEGNPILRASLLPARAPAACATTPRCNCARRQCVCMKHSHKNVRARALHLIVSKNLRLCISLQRSWKHFIPSSQNHSRT